MAKHLDLEENAVKMLTPGITKKMTNCPVKAKKGDMVAVHYTGKLADGTQFDSSLTRGQPIEFPLGVGRVIQGWDQGILGMCIGEKRKLTIPPHLGYGSAGAGGVIPPDATLVFTTELVAVNGKGKEILEEDDAADETEVVPEPEEAEAPKASNTAESGEDVEQDEEAPEPTPAAETPDVPADAEEPEDETAGTIVEEPAEEPITEDDDAEATEKVDL